MSQQEACASSLLDEFPRASHSFKRNAAGLTVGHGPHILRHTHASDLLSNGVPVHVAASRIGERAETLLRAYAHLLPRSAEVAASSPL